MKKIECLAVDDEPIALQILDNYATKLTDLAFTRCSDGVLAIELLKRKSFDLLFLDLQMPGFTGMELLQTLHDPPAIVITSAYTDFAVQAFEHEVLDYLVKPFAFPRFMKTMERFIRMQQYNNGAADMPFVQEPTGIFLKTEKTFCKINLQDILFVESVKDYIKVHTVKRSYLSCQTLTEFTSQLPAREFMRIHRSYTIALQKVDIFSKENVIIGRQQIPVSREHRKKVIDRLSTLFPAVV